MNETELKIAQEVGTKRNMLAVLEARLAAISADPVAAGREAIRRFNLTLGSMAYGLPAATEDECRAQVEEDQMQIEATAAEIRAFLAAHPLSAEQEGELTRGAAPLIRANRKTHQTMGW